MYSNGKRGEPPVFGCFFLVVFTMFLGLIVFVLAGVERLPRPIEYRRAAARATIAAATQAAAVETLEAVAATAAAGGE